MPASRGQESLSLTRPLLIQPLSAYNLGSDVGETVESCLVEMPVEGESRLNLQLAHEFEACAVSKAPSSTAAILERRGGLMK